MIKINNQKKGKWIKNYYSKGVEESFTKKIGEVEESYNLFLLYNFKEYKKRFLKNKQ